MGSITSVALSEYEGPDQYSLSCDPLIYQGSSLGVPPIHSLLWKLIDILRFLKLHLQNLLRQEGHMTEKMRKEQEGNWGVRLSSKKEKRNLTLTFWSSPSFCRHLRNPLYA